MMLMNTMCRFTRMFLGLGLTFNLCSADDADEYYV